MIVDCAVYEDGCRRDGQLDLDQAFEAAQAENAFVWIGLYEPSEKELKSARGFIAEYSKTQSRRATWGALCQALVASAEFAQR